MSVFILKKSSQKKRISFQFFAVLSSVLVAVLGGCNHTSKDTAKSSESDSLLKIAHSMHDKGNHKTAYSFYNQALEANPKNVQAHVGLIKMTRQNGELKNALRLSQVALTYLPDQKEIYLENVKTYLAMDNPRTALSTAEDVLKTSPKDSEVLMLVGVCEDTLLEPEKAQKCYKDALALDPKNIKTKGNLGLSQVLSGNTQEGLQNLKDVESDPFSTLRDRDNLALAHALSGDMKQARTLLASHLSEHELAETLVYFSSLKQKMK